MNPTSNCKLEARFLFGVKRNDYFFGFQAQLEGNIDAINESTQGTKLIRKYL